MADDKELGKKVTKALKAKAVEVKPSKDALAKIQKKIADKDKGKEK